MDTIIIKFSNIVGDCKIEITNPKLNNYFRYLYKLNIRDECWEQISLDRFETFEECWQECKDLVKPFFR